MKPVSRRVLLPAFAAVLTVSCAPAANAPAGGGASPPPEGRNVLSIGEIEASTQSTALAFIREKRPGWLRSRGEQRFTGQSGIDVYVDGTVMDFETLAGMPVRELARLEFLSAADATFRFGTQHGNPAILVTTKQRK